MTNLRLWSAGLAIMMCSAVVADDRHPPAPGVDSTSDAKARTFVEESSPATFGATVVRGAGGELVVRSVVPGSEAALAGLAANDILVSINGTPVTEPQQFQAYITNHPADALQIVAVRDGVEHTLAVRQPVHTSTATARPAIGVRFLQGPTVVIGEVLPGSPAARAGLLPGDQIVAVNNTPINSSDHFISLIAAEPVSSTLEFTYLRGGNRATISLAPGAWDTVFGSGSQYVALKPADETVVTTTDPVVPCASAYYPSAYYAAAYSAPWYNGYVSAVGVPGIAYPTYYGFPYGATYWASPYYYYGGYYGSYVYPNWYPYTWPVLLRYGGPYPGHPGPSKAKTESAEIATPADGRVVERLRTP